MITTIPVVDTETTGMKPEEGATVLEVAWVVLALPDTGNSPDEADWGVADSFSTLIEHEGDIPPEARAVHHIRPDQVAPGAPGAMPREGLIHSMLSAESEELCYAAHNSPFDASMLPELTRPWIDTCQCARHIWPDAPSYGNQVLRYWLGLEPDPSLLMGADGLPLAPHRALYDTAVTAEILRCMLRDHSADTLLRLSREPLLLKTCHLRKYQGVPWADVPRDYMRWIRDRTDMMANDANLAHTIRHYLEA